MTVRTTPTHMKKNVDAIKLADMGLSIPTLSNRIYNITPEVNARIKLTTAKTSEILCNTPFLLVMQIKIPVFSDRIGFLYSYRFPMITYKPYQRLNNWLINRCLQCKTKWNAANHCMS